jgi:nucleoside-diphosphate-sugar epimerase
MRVLITGGNGFVGRHLVTALRERGDEPRVLALPGENTSWLETRGVPVDRGDVRSIASLEQAIRGTDGVIHLAAMMDVWRAIEDYRAVNVVGTANVCRAAMGARVQRVVHMSSSSVYGNAARGPIDETFPLAPLPDPYPVTKAEGDRLVQQLAAADGLPAVILRPDQIFGPGDRLHFARMADRVRSGRSIVVGSGRNFVPFVYVSDVVQALLLALDHPARIGQAYNISTDRPLTQQGFLDAIARELAVPPPHVHVPYRALYAAGWLAERTAHLVGRTNRPPITRLGVSFLGSHVRIAVDKARRELGYTPQVPLKEAVQRTVDWYLAARGEAGRVELATQALEDPG